jgi:hypothetical protein
MPEMNRTSTIGKREYNVSMEVRRVENRGREIKYHREPSLAVKAPIGTNSSEERKAHNKPPGRA